MAKDYKYHIPDHQGYGRRSDGKPSKPLIWGGIGMLAVILLSGLFSLISSSKPMKKPPKTEGVGVESIKPIANENESKLDKMVEHPVPEPPKRVEPRFTFYKILPEKEVVIHETQIRAIKREEKQGKVIAEGTYTLQAGSTRNSEYAERIAAQIAALGINARIENVQTDTITWYLIKVGPFASMVEADNVRMLLKQNHLDSIIQKITK